MASQVRTQGGAVLLHRLGPLRMGEQSRWTRAPRPRGLWAFPWPLFEMFFAYHQYGYAAPLRLRTEQGLPVHPSGWVDRDDQPAPAGLTPAELREGPYEVRDGFHNDRDAWVRTVGRRTVRRREFWFAGDVYTHLTEKGDVLGIDQWRLMPAATFAQAVRRSGGDRWIYRTEEQVTKRPGSADHLEVFIAAGSGRLTGRAPGR